MSDPLSKSATATEIAGAVMSGKVKAAAVIDATLKRIEAAEPAVNAFTDVVADRARRRAAEIDAGLHRGPLLGVPFAVKNLFDIAGLPTRAGSKINVDGPKAERDGALVRKLEAAGAILVGGLNMGEYAYDFTGENAHYGPSRNPHDPTRMSGGSSGGSGAAVAAGEVPLALGSDTNGSIRVPSSLCGLFGLKPTYGRLSRAGSFPFVDSFDHLGPIARSAEDLALSFDAMQGWDSDDPVCTDRPADPTLPRLVEGVGGLRIGIAGDYFAKGGEPEAFEAVATVAKALGATKTVVLPQAAAARAAAYVITAIEGAQLHLPRLRTRPQDFDPDTRERFMAGALLPGAWYVKAQRFRRQYRAQVLKLFEEVDVILAPATPCTAPKLGQTMMTLDGVSLAVRANLGIYTQPISFIGLPVAVAPLQRPGGLPIGVQLIAKPYNEQAALRVAAHLQKLGVAAAPPA
ncbi:AtzE family amidohydrolase [Reyranella aquatilis]|uniref:AtzE family amidohydrolase n=1 Tax=Reyranella aquatilis TaxID=2035356 RepID=A0ABS8L357_9HYPH|nr:AtzE family amidohydrolase [Reyranella aquatilis]MCC8432754.1 AtzE family amidohydrolase [Reyranella aquatilis]